MLPRISYALAVACACALLSACGGGGGSSSAPSVTPHQPGVDLGSPNPSDNVDYAASAEYTRHYGLSAINAQEAYRRGYWGQGVTVAMLDSGLRRAHEDFIGADILDGYDFQQSLLLDARGMPVPPVVTVTMDYDTDGHGTPVAAVIGAARRGGSGGQGVAPSVSIMPLQVAVNTGPAPAYSFSHVQRAVEYAAAADAPIMNLSFGVSPVTLKAKTPVSGIRVGATPVEILEAAVPVIPELAARNAAYYDTGRFTRIKNAIRDKDTVVVYSAGNGGWHGGGGEMRFRIRTTFGTVQTEHVNYRIVGEPGFNMHQYIIDNFESVRYGALSDLGIKDNEASIESMGPAYEEELFGKWVAVAATDFDNNIAGFSNACGDAKYWCLAAPGAGLNLASNRGNTRYGQSSGTSFAAPHVSGALAVLRGRFPDMPMSAILAVLFGTATDLGAPGVDEVYGHGLLNLGAAVMVQGNMRLELPGRAQAGGLDAGGAGAPVAGALAAGGRIHLPPALAGLRERINNMSVAVSYLDGYYYDMPLSRFLSVDGSDSAIFSGNAAADMLQGKQSAQMLGGLSAVVNERAGALSALSYAGGGFRFSYDLPCDDCVSAWERGAASDDIMRPYFAASARRGIAGWRLSESIEVFAARGFEDEDKRQPSYEQLGLRWRAGEGPVRMLSEFSRVEEKDSLLGATGAALGDLSAQTYQGRLRLQSSLAGWQLSGDYVYGETKAKAKGGLISGVSDLRFDGWGMEAMRRSLLRGGDELRIGMRRHAHTRGKVRLWQSRAGAERFVEDLHLPLRDEVQYSEAIVTNLGALPTIWRAGYSAPLSPRMSAAFALEYADAPQADDEWSASAHFIWAF